MPPKAVLFDFDGVILESADIKTEAFLELFSDYPQNREAILRYHLENQGISRYRKFEWIYSEVLRRALDEEESRRLGEDFSQLVLGKILSCPFVPGAFELLEMLHPKCLLFIVSGTPQNELEHIVLSRGLSPFFTEVWGSPPAKSEIIGSILRRFGLANADVLFVGDGISDYRAAEEANVPFLARERPEVGIEWKQVGVATVADLCAARALFEPPEREAAPVIHEWATE